MKFDTLISCNDLAAHLQHADWLVFDCRFDLADVDKGERGYREAHIPGAQYAHLDHHLSSPITESTGRHPMPDIDQLLQWLGTCGMHTNKQVVVYDDSFGTMAARLWWLLKCLGHEAVALLDGGWQAWQSGSYEVNDHRVKAQNTHFQAHLDESHVVSTEQLLDNLDDPRFVLVDVRTEERFLGISEPIDPVAGHIPAAVNIPLTENLDPDGYFKSPAQLRELYASVIDSCDPQQQVYMCGSGVTACHSIVGMSVAGYALPRVYAGSWSEWIRDPQRPVALHKDNPSE